MKTIGVGITAALINGITADPKLNQMTGDEKKLMKKSIAENMMQSTHFNGGFASGPQFGTIRHKPESLTKQQICIDIPTLAELKSAESNGEAAKAAKVKQHITIKTMKSIMDGTYQDWIEHLTAHEYPQPKVDLDVFYNHESYRYLDLGNEFDLGNDSFTVAAMIRLRPDPETSANFTNRGARILSKRTDNGQGWELVAPSFYTGAVSLYAGNDLKQPGHIDYGRSRLPDNTWMCVGVSVDRESFGNGMAHVVPFVNGFSDGPGTSMRMEGTLSNDVPITLGNHRDESGQPVEGRRDFNIDGSPRFEQHFQGDINKIMYWDQALQHKEIRMMCRQNLAKMGVKTGNCPKGYEEFDCQCYKVVDHELKTFSEAESYCRSEGGMLAMPKTDQHQDFIEILMQQSHSESFWIGLDDLKEENVHVWADGTVLNYEKGAYNRYPKGRPDKIYQSEDCVENVKSRGGFFWNDENCAKVNSFVCQLTDSVDECVQEHGSVASGKEQSHNANVAHEYHDELLAQLLETGNAPGGLKLKMVKSPNSVKNEIKKNAKTKRPNKKIKKNKGFKAKKEKGNHRDERKGPRFS